MLSSGAVVRSVGTRRVALGNAGSARSLLVRGDGSALVGTGNDGKIFKVTGDVASEFGETGELLVTSIVEGEHGTLYAGTLPHGKIFAIDAQGKATLFAQPDGDRAHLGAGLRCAQAHAVRGDRTARARCSRSTPKGKAEAYFTTQGQPVMALALAPDGSLYAGTSDDALLCASTAPGRAQVVYDFEGNEVTAIALRDGSIAVAANQFPKPPSRRQEGREEGRPAEHRQDRGRKDAPKPGTGELWVVEASGQARKLFASDDGHITAVQWAQGGAIYAATGKGGHIYRVQQDGTNALWIDVDERQVLDLQMLGEHPMFMTGDAGALYRVLPGAAQRCAVDEQGARRAVPVALRPARPGAAQGKLSFQTRSGNTEKPDDGWSDWSSVLDAAGSDPQPGRALFADPRAKLDAAPGRERCTRCRRTTCRAINRRRSRTSRSSPPRPRAREDAPTAQYKIEWKVDNPDGDGCAIACTSARRSTPTLAPDARARARC